MTDVLVVTNEPVWPTVNGGRVRMAAIISALRDAYDVDVLESTRRPWWRTAGGGPRLGRLLLDPRAVEVAAPRAKVVLYSHSYLEPVGPQLWMPVVVDFQNLEVDRQRSLASEGPAARRVIAAVEAAKARWWEPRVARRAALAVAVTDDDAEVLRRWGASRVVVVPNAADAARCGPSPADGPVTFLANVAYPPNRAAAERLERDVWPLVVRRRPDARLRIAGRGTAEEVDDIGPVFAAASMMVAPVTEGGGTQLKVVEALAHGRVVVASAYSAASAPPAARDACVSTVDASDMADAIVRLLDDVEDRHRRERAAAAVPTWTDALAPLVREIGTLL